MLKKQESRIKRKMKIRKRVSGTSARPRVTVFRSNKVFYVQFIDDLTGKTLLSGDTKNLKSKTPIEKSFELGKTLSSDSQKLNIKKIIFDRNGYKYHGRVESFAKGLRENGLEF